MSTQMTLPIGNAAGAWRGEVGETSGLGRLVAAVRRHLAFRRIYRQTFAELQMLTDRELDDIGVARCDIRQIARDTAAAALAARG